ncbi:hypothetical protein SAMN05421821_11084 [Mucilaginibacter lappiensis]|uniref:Uncharacterized protein n=1 Tax=Mucilaginibacter lappiensis TaxID=354630 RepID=A0ABR6PMS6_9SPHI|nr:hypothetical protein [Mucilaginibacter lappiensis]MBB6111065.1 hypothetical protein [Mucilaginibacter lappiensis]SIR68417.1 hypothetical protein SAMN05421821_11084 [Mucilaginibacter lappiensis]
MYRVILVIVLLSANSLLSRAQTTPDMTAFGYALGEKLTIPECPCQIVKSTTGSGVLYAKHFKGYKYTTGPGIPVSSTCFERIDIDKYTVKKSDQLDPLPAFTDGEIRVRFAPADAPSKDMCPTGTFDASVSDSKLIAVYFIIYTGDANNIFETLKKKYGTNVALKNYQMQNGYGATLNYYTAAWGFPNLYVILLSSLHSSLSEQFGKVTIELPQKSDAQPEAKRKL